VTSHSLFLALPFNIMVAYVVCLSGQQQTAEVLWVASAQDETTCQAKRHMQRLQLEALLSLRYLPC
jgi:hypothetical protein